MLQVNNHLSIFNFDMKKFLIKTLLIAGIPVVIAFTLYWITDPFKINRSFSLNDASEVNREYFSTELFLKQNQKYHYNSFVFCSSRGIGINTYTWKYLLNKSTIQKDTVSQYLFQSWSETIYGINQKIEYLDKNNVPINNALILIDVGTSFKENTDRALAKKHYKLSGESKMSYQMAFIQAYMESPFQIVESVKNLWSSPKEIRIDSISNDWVKDNKYNYMAEPVRDSTLNKSKFDMQRPVDEQFHEKEITDDYLKVLKNIKRILDKQQTQYKIVITPSSYNQVHINKEDLAILQQIFGENNVYNFSGKNYMTEDKYNWEDPIHFGLIVGWWMLNEIYQN